MAGGDLDVAEADAGVEHGGHEGVAQHVRVHLGHADAGGGGEVLEPAGRGVPVHPGADGVAQDRPVEAFTNGPVDSAGHCGWQRDEDDLAALAVDAQHTVSVFLAQVGDARAAGFEDS
nr:hypothetical protein [Actinoplanes sp. RD1]